MVDEIPNLGAAIRTYIRESTVLISAPYLGSNTKISIGFPRDKDNKITVPTFSDLIVIMTGRGGRGDIGLGRLEERVDFLCYGQDEAKCKKIWRALYAYLFQVSLDRKKTYFTRNQCQVNKLTLEGGPLTLTDPDAADWPYTVGTVLFEYCAFPR